MSAFPGTLRRRVAVAFVVVGIVVAAAFASTTATFADLLADRSYLVDRIAPAGLAGRDFLGAMVNQESGMRGFVLTGQERFLAPYEEGRDSLIEAQERVLALVGDTPSLAVAMAGATDAAARWQRDSAEPLVAAVRSDGPEVVSEPELDESRKAFERFRSAMGELDRRLAFEREQAEERLEDSTRRLSATALGVVVLIVLGGVAVVLGLRRWVLAPLDRLGAETRAVTAGEFERPITPAGPAEIAEVAADTEAMRQRILTELAAATEAREQLATQARELAAQAEELAAQAEELARSNADLEQFAYVASHDLQEPLRKVASFCQLLQRRYQGQLDERGDQYIEFAVDGAKRMQLLVNDLLAFSRVGRTTERFEPVELDAALGRALRNLELAVEETGARIDAGSLPTVEGDPGLLCALFQNLIGNALKFTADDAPRVRVTVSAEDDRWSFAVSDNGIGIDAAYAERVFVIFQRLHGKEAYPGTGIGLALCKKIVEFHGGAIWIDTGAEQGTTVRWTLPMIPEEPAEAVASSPAPEGELIVD